MALGIESNEALPVFKTVSHLPLYNSTRHPGSAVAGLCPVRALQWAPAHCPSGYAQK
ncbi:MAG: hypothetical protein ACKOX6_11430 [Bdellovibrio sp.]